MSEVVKRLRWLAGGMPARALVPSLAASYRHTGDVRRAVDLPVVAGPGSRLIGKPTSTIELGGTLFLGYGPPDNGGSPALGQAFVRVGAGSRFQTGGWVVVREDGDIRVAANASLAIGDAVYINERVRIDVHDSITIGAGCALSWDVLVMDTDYHHLAIGGEERPVRTPIVIGDNVWIGTRSVVTKGVTIGTGAVIAACSVVTRDIPSRCLAAGVPARVIHEDVEWWP